MWAQPKHTRGAATIELEIYADEKTLNIPSSRLLTGNCLGIKDLPQVLQLPIGEVLEMPVNISGVPAMAYSKDTVFYARWDRPDKNTIRVYGGCSWAYTCGGMTGNSDIQFTITQP